MCEYQRIAVWDKQTFYVSPADKVTCHVPLSWTSPGKNTRVGCCFLLQGIFPTQGSTLVSYVSYIGRWVLYQQHHTACSKSPHGASRESRLVLASYWLSLDSSHWLGLLLGGGKSSSGWGGREERYLPPPEMQGMSLPVGVCGLMKW